MKWTAKNCSKFTRKVWNIWNSDKIKVFFCILGFRESNQNWKFTTKLTALFTLYNKLKRTKIKQLRICPGIVTVFVTRDFSLRRFSSVNWNIKWNTSLHLQSQECCLTLLIKIQISIGNLTNNLHASLETLGSNKKKCHLKREWTGLPGATNERN